MFMPARKLAARLPVLSAVVLMTLTATAPPASAAVIESGYWLAGGPGRSLATPVEVNFHGRRIQAVTGLNYEIWWRDESANGPWREIGNSPNALSVRAPELVVFNGDLIALHTGNDHRVYYNRLTDLAANAWTGWRQVPGSQHIEQAVSATVINNTMVIWGADAQGALHYHRMYNARTHDFANAIWRSVPGEMRAVGAPEVITVPNGNLERIWAFVTNERDHAMYTMVHGSESSAPEPSRSPWRVMPWPASEGVFQSGPRAVTHDGEEATQNYDHDDNFNRQHDHITVTGRGNDGQVYLAQSANGGSDWTDWNTPRQWNSNSSSFEMDFSPVYDTPNVTVDAGNGRAYLLVNWNGTRSSRFPDSSLVEKQLGEPHR